MGGESAPALVDGLGLVDAMAQALVVGLGLLDAMAQALVDGLGGLDDAIGREAAPALVDARGWRNNPRVTEI